MMTATTVEPRAWVGCLACYNDGRLVGDWVDGEEAAEFVPCTRSEYGSPHEEWWCLDHEGMPFITGECSPAEFTEATVWWNEHIEHRNPDAVLAWMANTDESWSELDNLDAFDEQYRGEWDSMEDYAQHLFEQTAQPEDRDVFSRWPFSCIDWAHAARELGHDHWSHRDGSTIHVFSNA